MAFGGSLPQINLGVQGVTQGAHHNYLEYSPAVKALYIYKHPCLLWDSDPTAQQLASLAIIADGWHSQSEVPRDYHTVNVDVSRDGCQRGSRPHHLTMLQNDEVGCQ
ncbi:hypothetical protein TNCV_4600501 [Trichonephila clavipes]|nr:hypothetical protein TNCV_4600501 [Trichonephila clavipes]